MSKTSRTERCGIGLAHINVSYDPELKNGRLPAAGIARKEVTGTASPGMRFSRSFLWADKPGVQTAMRTLFADSGRGDASFGKSGGRWQSGSSVRRTLPSPLSRIGLRIVLSSMLMERFPRKGLLAAGLFRGNRFCPSFFRSLPPIAWAGSVSIVRPGVFPRPRPMRGFQQGFVWPSSPALRSHGRCRPRSLRHPRGDGRRICS